MDFIDELKWRGLVKDVTDEEGLKERFKTKVTAYCGIDPTADSLHIGHLQQILLMKRYQNAGHRVIALCGGATGMIGDPRPTTERRLITLEEVAHNVECIKGQVGKFVDFSDPDKGLLLNNHDWLSQITLLGFLRDYGKHFNVATMINKDIIQKRLDSGISYTEFTYTILQAADWLYLYQNYNCEVQFGGSDQWGNLVSGSELIRKVLGPKEKVYGITSPLITKGDGSKFGKSEGGNIWLDPNKTSAFDFYQFWINVGDDEIVTLLKRLSMRSPEEIMELEKQVKEEPQARAAQKALAEELTKTVHGQAGLEKAQRITETLFSGNIMDLSADEIREGLKGAKATNIADETGLLDAMVAAEITKSKGEARKLVQQGAVSINGEKISDINFSLKKADAIDNEFSILKKGKKNYFIFNFE